MKLVRKSKRVLVVDDVINSGSRLRSYNRALREEYGTFRSISILVGVARMQSRQELRDLKTALCDGHPWLAELQFVYEVVLPRWDAPSVVL